MLLASMDPAPAHSELATLKTYSRASCARDVTVLQCRGFHVDTQPAPIEVKGSAGMLQQVSNHSPMACGQLWLSSQLSVWADELV